MLKRRSTAAAALTGLLALLVTFASGCSSAGSTADSSNEKPRPVIERAPPPGREKQPAETVVASHCPAGLPGCRTTEGTIVYVEEVDPDGDGDAHFVIIDSKSITLPGLTAIDVGKDLRPHPLPHEGDLISAAGPVQTGSYGQSQIHALELHAAE